MTSEQQQKTYPYEIYKRGGELAFTAQISEAPIEEDDVWNLRSHEEKCEGLAVLWAVKNNVSLKGLAFIGADLSDADLSDADLSGAIFVGANFENAVLVGTDFRSSNLMHACFKYADLTKANLRGADLQVADLFFAELEGAFIDGACFGKATMPNGDRYNDCIPLEEQITYDICLDSDRIEKSLDIYLDSDKIEKSLEYVNKYAVESNWKE